MAIPYHTFPTIDLGPITLRTFGLFVALGLMVGIGIFRTHGRRAGLDLAALSRVAWLIAALGIVGSRAAYVIAHPQGFLERPWGIFALWEGGLELAGGFLAAVVILLAWLRRHRDVPGLVLADAAVLGLSVGLAIGRLGCYAVGEHLGGETTFPLAVRYLGGPTREGPIAIGAQIHHTALYEALLLLPLAALLFVLRRRGVGPGWLTATFFLWYGVQRFSTDFLRAYDRTVLGLTGAQYLCIVLVVAGIWFVVKLLRSRARSGEPSPAAS
jgi:phosphatidylglycerol:prolipoprotein diacylglycerol transferase